MHVLRTIELLRTIGFWCCYLRLAVILVMRMIWLEDEWSHCVCTAGFHSSDWKRGSGRGPLLSHILADPVCAHLLLITVKLYIIDLCIDRVIFNIIEPVIQ